MLKDKDVNLAVAWSLEQIGDKSGIRPLIGTLEDRDLYMRVAAINALGKVDATEALPTGKWITCEWPPIAQNLHL